MVANGFSLRYQIQEQYNLLREASATPDSSGIPLSWFVVLKDVASKVEVCRHLNDTSCYVLNGDPNYAHQLPSWLTYSCFVLQGRTTTTKKPSSITSVRSGKDQRYSQRFIKTVQHLIEQCLAQSLSLSETCSCLMRKKNVPPEITSTGMLLFWSCCECCRP